MNKICALLLSSLLIAGITSTAQAQTPFGFGIKGGMTIADLTGSDIDTDSRVGGMIGLSLDFTLPMLPIAIESGLYYTQKGTEFSEAGTDVTTKLDYLEIPVLAKVFFMAPGPINPHILAGPYIGFNVNAEEEFTINGQTDVIDFSNEINATDVGLLFGLGTDLNIGVAALNIQARYSIGLIPVFDEAENDIYNSVFSVVLGFNL